jgi:cell division septal protein FtsQ
MTASAQTKDRRPRKRKISLRTLSLQFRRLLTLIALGAVLSAECIGALLTSPLFRVRTITVNGTAQLLPAEKADVLAAVTPLINSNFFRPPSSNCVRRLTAIPAVQSGSVNRTLKGGLIITVQPRQSHAVLLSSNGGWQIAKSGLVIRPSNNTNPNVPIISCGCGDLHPGDEPATFRLQSALLVLNRLGTQAGLLCRKITVDPDDNVWLNVLGNVAVNLGQPQHINRKLKILSRIAQEDPNVSAKVSTIDLTYPEQPACVVSATEQSATVKAGNSRRSSNASAPHQGLQ